MEDYKKKYEQALERARKINNGDGVAAPHDYTICETIFPELKESRDERIRKECISIIDAWDKLCRLQGDYCEVAPECIAWLEKQGEQKPTDKVEQEEDVELTDFESALFSAFSDAWQEYLSGKEVNVAKWAREHSAELLEVAIEQKPAWSEENEKTIDEVISLIDMLASGYGEKVTESITFNGVKMINNIKERLRNLHQKPNHWKPSDEQMSTLDAVIDEYDGYPEFDSLVSLKNDLKKLREE